MMNLTANNCVELLSYIYFDRRNLVIIEKLSYDKIFLNLNYILKRIKIKHPVFYNI